MPKNLKPPVPKHLQTIVDQKKQWALVVWAQSIHEPENRHATPT